MIYLKVHDIKCFKGTMTQISSSSHRRRGIFFAGMLLMGFLLRIVLVASLSSSSNDVLAHYQQDAEIIRRNENIYADMEFYNYAPVWAYTLAVFSNPIDISARVFIAVCDMFNAILIYLIAVRAAVPALAAAALYLFNPVVLMNGGFGAQFEPYALAPLLVGIWLALPLVMESRHTIRHHQT